MASGKSTYLENAVLAAALTNVSFSAPATLYVALTTSTPTVGQTGATITEPVDANYTRVAITSAQWAAIASGSTHNTPALTTFFGAGAATGGFTITSIAIVDAGPAYHAAGNLLYFGDLSLSKLINAGDTASIAGSALTITET
jgi:hypothetical protein